MAQNTPFVLPQRNYTAYDTLAAADAALVFKQAGQIIYAINVDTFYYWDGAAWQTLATGSGEGTEVSSLPIVRCVYLVNDAADQTALGGTTNNVYVTFQAAYNAANTLQIALGGSSIVAIFVYNTVATTVGDLTLTAAYNINVRIVGMSQSVSNLGNIIATNSSGNGYDVGNANSIFLSHVTIGNISTNATGATGNSGTVNIAGNASTIGNITTAITGTSTGVGGSVTIIQTQNNGMLKIGNITTSAKSGQASAAGSVGVLARGSTVGNITTGITGNTGGFISLSDLNSVGTVNSISTSGTTAHNFNYLRTIGTVTLTIPNNQPINATLTTFNTISLTCSGNGAVQPVFTMIHCTTNAVTSDIKILIHAHCTIFNRTLTNLGDNSLLMNCNVTSTTVSTPAITGIGTGVKIWNTQIMSGNYSLSNSTPVFVSIKDCQFEKGVNNVTAVQVVTAAPTVTLDCSLSESFEITLDQNVQIELSNAVPSEVYKITLIQDGVGGWSVSLPTAYTNLVANGGSGAVTLTGTIASRDSIVGYICSDNTTIEWTAIPNFT